jgi:hypothetical protein
LESIEASAVVLARRARIPRVQPEGVKVGILQLADPIPFIVDATVLEALAVVVEGDLEFEVTPLHAFAFEFLAQDLQTVPLDLYSRGFSG